MDDADSSRSKYVGHDIESPVLTGLSLRLFLALIETPAFAPVRNALLKKNGFPRRLQILDDKDTVIKPLFMPDPAGWPKETSGVDPAFVTFESNNDPIHVAQKAAQACESSSNSKIFEFHRAYTSKSVTPTTIAQRFLKAVVDSEAMTPPMRFFIASNSDDILSQAQASTERYAANAPLSPLDGILFAVKDEVDVHNYPTTAGTAFIASIRSVEKSLPGVEALMAAGAICVGKTTMHEIGLGTTGLNTVTGTARNPHDPSRHTGGSSSGSSAVVAAGLVPIAIGADGGGSIRIPCTLCGVVGLKPTHARICPYPGPQVVHSVGTVGPIAASVADCAILYAMMANRGHDEYNDLPVPPLLRLPLLPSSSLQGLRVGVYWDWFNHVDHGIATICKSSLRHLTQAGASIVPINLPLLDHVNAAHSCTISSEMRSCMHEFYEDPVLRRQFNAETRISLAVADGFSSAMYVAAQKIRRRADSLLRTIFQEHCAVIVTPGCPIVAPPVLQGSDRGGSSDLRTTVLLMRFMQLANFLGLPGIVVPVGMSNDNLPVGLQVIAPCYHEATLFKVAAVVERQVSASLSPPQVFWELIQQEKTTTSA